MFFGCYEGVNLVLETVATDEDILIIYNHNMRNELRLKDISEGETLIVCFFNVVAIEEVVIHVTVFNSCLFAYYFRD